MIYRIYNIKMIEMSNVPLLITIIERTFKGKIMAIVIALFIIYLASLDDFREYSIYMYLIAFAMIIFVLYLWVTKKQVY